MVVPWPSILTCWGQWTELWRPPWKLLTESIHCSESEVFCQCPTEMSHITWNEGLNYRTFLNHGNLGSLSWGIIHVPKTEEPQLVPNQASQSPCHSNILRNLILRIILFWAPPHGSTLDHSRCRCTPRHHPAPAHTQLRYPRPPQMNVSQGPFTPTRLGVSLKVIQPEMPLGEVNRKELPACTELWQHGKKQTRVVDDSLVLF